MESIPVEGGLDYYNSIVKTLKAIFRGRNDVSIGTANKLLDGHAIIWQRRKFSYVNRDTDYSSTIFIEAYEPKTYKEIKKSQGRLFVDVGAYAGVYSILAARNFERVISLQPIPETFEVLRRNVELNHLTNVEILQKAASDRNQNITFYEGLWSSTWTAIENFKLAKKKEGRTIQIEGVRLDGLLSSYESIDLVKMDVEGYEIQVLNGMQDILSKIHKIIVEADKENQTAIREILHNFHQYTLEPGNISDNLMFTRKS